MIAYLDTPSGISGDMFLGCLLDAGWMLDDLRHVVTRLGIAQDSWQIDIVSVMRGPLQAILANVKAEEESSHRHLGDIVEIIERAELSQTVTMRATAVFTRLARAEADVHGMRVDDVHFHEVGAVDAIIDIVGVCAGLEALGIEQLYAGALPLGPGWTQSAHGRIPLPAPATLKLLAAANAPTRPSPGAGELVTPTGAALLCELATFVQPSMTIQRIATGAGQKEFDWPNIARLWLGEPLPSHHEKHNGQLVQLETNIDDMNPELYGHVIDKLFDAGALDVWLTPIQMKKQRPGTLLATLARAENEEALSNIILRETTTLGIRVHRLHRHEAARQIQTVETPLGPARIKLKQIDGEVIRFAPEYDDCRKLAETHSLPLHTVYEIVRKAALPSISSASANSN